MTIERNMEDVVAAPYGTYTINSTTLVDGLLTDVLQVDTATVFALIYVNGGTTNMASQYILSPSGTVQPTLICALPGHTFTAVQLTSGQVTAVKNRS